MAWSHAYCHIKNCTHIYTHLRGSSLCNKRHKWPLTLHLCPMCTYFTDTATYCVTICELALTTHAPGKKNYFSSCREDMCWCVIVIHCRAAAEQYAALLIVSKCDPIPSAAWGKDESLSSHKDKVRKDIFWLKTEFHNLQDDPQSSRYSCYKFRILSELLLLSYIHILFL